jgi:hypothetical protein
MTSSTRHAVPQSAPLSAPARRPRLARLTLGAIALLMCGGWAGDLPAVPPAIVVVNRPDNRTFLDKNGRDLTIGAGAVFAAGFFLRKMTHRRGSDD